MKHRFNKTVNVIPNAGRSYGRSDRFTWPVVRRASCSSLAMLLAFAIIWPTSLLHSQEYTFTTLAGPGGGPGANDGPARAARFNTPLGVAVDAMGNMYLTDSYNSTIRKITPAGVVTTLAGLAGSRGSANGTGSAARFNFPTGEAVDAGGNLYVADEFNHTIRKITPGGVVSTLAGSAGQSGSANGTGGTARFNYPRGLAVDATGNVYVADSDNSTIRKITPSGVVTTLAGLAGSTGSDDGTGSVARFNYPLAVAVDGGSNLYVADTFNHTIRKIAPGSVVTTLAGQAENPGSSNGTGGGAQFSRPIGVTADSTGNVYVTDNGNHTIRKVTPDGVVTTLAGDSTQLDPDGYPLGGYADGSGSAARFNSPIALALDGAGHLFVADASNYTIRQMTTDGAVTTLAGNPTLAGGDDGTGSVARFNYPTSIAADKAGALYVADAFNHIIRKMTAGGVVTTLAGLAGNPGSDDGTGNAARFNYPVNVLPDNAGNLYVADGHNHTIRKVTSGGEVTTFVGTPGVSGSDDGIGSAAQFNQPRAMVLDSVGNLYVIDRDNCTIRKVTPAGEVTTLAGMPGIPGSANGTGSAAQFNYPRSMAMDKAGNLYVADSVNCTIRKVTPAGVVTTLAGLAGAFGSANGTGSAARFNVPFGIASDGADNLFVGDTSNNTIRRVTTAGVVTTVAGLVQLDPGGTPIAGSADGTGSAARFNQPGGIAVDNAGNLYVPDSFNNSIRFGTTNTCPDQPTIDLASGPAGQKRQLDTSPQTAVAWQWSLIRRPANSAAAFSDPNVRNPTFTPDVADLYIFQLKATNASGAICIRTVSLTATLAPPSILASSFTLNNGQCSFIFLSRAGNAVEIQTSSDLTNWPTAATVTNLTGVASFTDPTANSQPRFYRLKQL